MESRGHRAALLLVPVLIAVIVFVIAATVTVMQDEAWPLVLAATFIISFPAIIGFIFGGMAFATRGIELNLSIPAALRYRKLPPEPEPEPEPTDLPFSDDEYAQMRKRVPFIGLVRSGYTDTSEVMSDNPRPEIAGTIENVTVTGSVATRPVATRPPPTGPDSTTEHRQKA